MQPFGFKSLAGDLNWIQWLYGRSCESQEFSRSPCLFLSYLGTETSADLMKCLNNLRIRSVSKSQTSSAPRLPKLAPPPPSLSSRGSFELRGSADDPISIKSYGSLKMRNSLASVQSSLGEVCILVQTIVCKYILEYFLKEKHIALHFILCKFYICQCLFLWHWYLKWRGQACKETKCCVRLLTPFIWAISTSLLIIPAIVSPVYFVLSSFRRSD